MATETSSAAPTDPQNGNSPAANAPETAKIPKRLSIVRQLIRSFSWITYLVTLLVFTIPFAGLVYPIQILDVSDKFFATIFYWVVISVLYFIVLLVGGVTERFWWRKKNLEKDIRELYERLETGDFFTTLIRINFKYIDKYYLQTQLQANKSFYLSAAAAVVSLIMIVTGIVMLFTGAGENKVTPSYVTMAAGALGEFIATIFFYLYNRTVLEMSNYHQKLVLTQNISLALRIADNLDDKVAKAKAQTLLIECLCKDINMYLTTQWSKTGKQRAAPVESA